MNEIKLTKAVPQKSKYTNTRKMYALVIVGLVLLLFLAAFSVTQGVSDTPIVTILDALLSFDPENKQHLIIIDLRLPRVIASTLVGAALAVAGAVMQGITRNPMADSGLMGLNAGAGLALSICFAFLPKLTYIEIVLFCFAGAALSAAFVGGIGSSRRGGNAPMRLVLAGAAVSALLTALSQGIALCFDVSQNIMFWVVGGVSASTWNQIAVMTPCIVVALIGAVLISPKITLMSLGEEVAKGLGLKTILVNIICSIIIVILAGVSVSVVGAVSFIGLIIPHIARFIVGVDYCALIPSSAVMGSLLMVAADLGARKINPPSEMPIGALISLIGVPFFLYLARKQRRAE
ncbi:putative siderophore transport system permease protein YfiZ precursor [Anaerotignum neopropionicum]|uniref:Putative siderophore transport system permease protein YfiZ n=1 Tax=Anaerotignum neopropionicum TaxID=36847 RepID=A0A136WCJ7_9FIRM|nr:iron ABC transporter permease [Anaerotignum neopropionicum]KXL52224.1 putative siderophore transport system permease protein YfiZ precursor [Anaerotignum neopropionicum]